MQLIIIYNKPYILTDIEDNVTILELKNRLQEKYQITHKMQKLQYAGRILSDEMLIRDYGIRNNSIVFLNLSLNGGAVSGFPNVGHLIVLLGVSTLMLLFCYFFFYNMMNSIDVIINKKDCKSLTEINQKLYSESTLGPILQYKDQITGLLGSKISPKRKKLRKGGALELFDTMGDFLYTLSSMFYSAVVVIILTIYAYTLFCHEGLSTWLVVICIISFILMFIVFYVLYILVDDMVITSTFATEITTYIFIILGILLLLMTFIIPAQMGEDYMHWTTYLYPIGVMVTVALQYYITKYTNWSGYIKIMVFLGMVGLFIFFPYTLAYIYNVYKLCQ